LLGHSATERALTSLPHGIFDYLLKTTAPDVALQRIMAGLERRRIKQHQKQAFQRLLDAALELGVELDADTSRAAAIPASSQHEDTISIGSLRIDALRQEVELAGRTVELTPTEVRVLACLAQHAGSMLSYSQLVQSVLGYEASPAQASELIKPHLYHLRQKLERDPVHPRYLLNVRGNGYMFAPDHLDEVNRDANWQELAELVTNQV
jgi:DNA-binding response OmpR family regulator